MPLPVPPHDVARPLQGTIPVTDGDVLTMNLWDEEVAEAVGGSITVAPDAAPTLVGTCAILCPVPACGPSWMPLSNGAGTAHCGDILVSFYTVDSSGSCVPVGASPWSCSPRPCIARTNL